MNREVALTWSWLNVLSKKRYDALIGAYKNMETALQSLDEEILSKIGCRQETIIHTFLRLEEFDPSSYEKELQKRDLHFITIEDDEYPQALREIGDPPVFLYYQGDLTILNQPCIAMVGTRAMTNYGKRVGELFTPSFIRAGMVTVSGLAEGIDSVVAKESLLAQGKTVAVLGHGHAYISPKAKVMLADEIVQKGGIVLSEYPIDTKGDKFTFPARNRIIAGLSLATVVLEAGVESGALITADLALDYSREVFAVPGEIFDPVHAGCNLLISKGHGKLVSSPEDVLQELGIIASTRAPSNYEPQNESESSMLSALTTMPQSTTELSEKTNMSVGDINATLTMLELSGAAQNVGNGRWVKC